MRRQEGCAFPFSPQWFRYNYAKIWTKKCSIWLILSSGLLVLVPRVPRGCQRPRGGVPALTLHMLWGGMWKERPRLDSLVFFFLFFTKGIADYIARCKQGIGKFESLVHQIHKNADDIASRLTLIESINLFKYPAPKNEEELPGTSDFLFSLIMEGMRKPLGHDCARAHTHTQRHTLYLFHGIKTFRIIYPTHLPERIMGNSYGLTFTCSNQIF